MSTFLILLAAGNSTRLKSYIPKPYLSINNKTLIERALESFKDFKKIKKTVIVYNKNHRKYLNKINVGKSIKVVGGKTRQESTFNGLKRIQNMNCQKVIIHDVARPSPPKIIIKKILNGLKKNNAVVPVIKAQDAVKRVKKNNIFKFIDRNTLRFSQTPQGFNYKKIYKKHKENLNLLFDDDSSFFTNDNEKVKTINGSKENLKITDKEDLLIFTSSQKKKTYHGIGFDIHKLIKGKKLYLSGINIPFEYGLLGHSDGDPVVHALIDSLLGACRMGDVGEHFPDTNKKYKNIKSTILLRKVIEKIKFNNFHINNIDINIIAQKPKIKKYKKKMLNKIGKICQINLSKINIKGKTTEKLGLIGKGKAIASEVITSVEKYD